METTYEITFGGGKKVSAHVRDFIINTDQPVSDGGNNSAPSPFEFFLASIGMCAGFYVVSFCQARAIPIDNIKLTQTITRNNTTHMVEKIAIEILLPPDFPEKYKGAVIRAAESCTVKKHLTSPPDIKINGMDLTYP
jgi:ribosomal protein S12 methylthiotransferase accessory factor